MINWTPEMDRRLLILAASQSVTQAQARLDLGVSTPAMRRRLEQLNAKWVCAPSGPPRHPNVRDIKIGKARVSSTPVPTVRKPVSKVPVPEFTMRLEIRAGAAGWAWECESLAVSGWKPIADEATARRAIAADLTYPMSRHSTVIGREMGRMIANAA